MTEAEISVAVSGSIGTTEDLYRGETTKMRWSAMTRSRAFGANHAAASIDTPLHAPLPSFPHVDHLHPDWAIASAASANGKKKTRTIQQGVSPPHRVGAQAATGIELAPTIEKAVRDNPDIDGILLGGHGLFDLGRDSARVLSKIASTSSIRWASLSLNIRVRRVRPSEARCTGRDRIVNRWWHRFCLQCAARCPRIVEYRTL